MNSVIIWSILSKKFLIWFNSWVSVGGWSMENRAKKTPFWFRVEQWGHGTSHLVTSNQELAVSRYLYRSHISLELSKMCRKLSTVRIAPRCSSQRNESQDVSLHNTAFFDDERPKAKRRNEWICKAIASKAAAYQALDRLDTKVDAFTQRFVVAEEGIRSNDSFLCISNDSTAD